VSVCICDLMGVTVICVLLCGSLSFFFESREKYPLSVFNKNSTLKQKYKSPSGKFVYNTNTESTFRPRTNIRAGA